MCGLISNDHNLRIKALAHGLPALGIQKNDDGSALVTEINPSLLAVLGYPTTKPFQSIDLPSAVPQFDEDIILDDLPPSIPYSTTMSASANNIPSISSATHFHLSPQSAPDFITSISEALSRLLPQAIEYHLIKSTDPFTASHLLRSYPHLQTWTAAISLTALTTTFSSLENLWLLPEAPLEGSAASRWASTSKPTNTNIRAVRTSVQDLRTVFGNERNGKSSYALKKNVREWDRSCWMGFVYDLETLLVKGTLLDGSGQENIGKGLVSEWRKVVQGFQK